MHGTSSPSAQLVDGDLSDWVQILPGSTIGANHTEEAYFTFVDFYKGPASGDSTVYLAYDDKNFILPPRFPTIRRFRA